MRLNRFGLRVPKPIVPCSNCGIPIESTKITPGKRIMLHTAYPECRGWCDQCIGHHIVDKTFKGKTPSYADAQRILKEARK